MWDVGEDVRLAARRLASTPGFTAVALLTLALGIGANSAIFTVLNQVVLRPLSYPEPERIVELWGGRPASKQTLERLRTHGGALAELSGFRARRLSLVGDGDPIEVRALEVTPNHFDVLGVPPALGRAFLSSEGRGGSDPVVILSHGLWASRYGSDPGVLGRTVQVGGTGRSVIGVMPEGYRSVLDGVQLWLPHVIDPSDEPDYLANARTTLLARLPPGTTLERASAEMTTAVRALQGEDPELFDDERVRQATVVLLQIATTRSIRGNLWLLLGAAGLVLLVACVNLSHLLLARATDRSREMGVRRALGAGRGRLLRLLLTESLLLCVAGGLLGVALGAGGLSLLGAVGGQGVLAGGAPTVDGVVLAFSVLLSLGTGLLFGLAPALHGTGTELTKALRDGTQGGGRSRRRQRADGVLMVGELTLVVMLVVGTGLLVKSSWRLTRVHPGFEAQGVLTVRVNPPESRYESEAAAREYYRAVSERVASVPGVQSVGIISYLPMTGGRPSTLYYPGAAPWPETLKTRRFADFQWTGHGYAETMGIGVLRGRWFDDRDRDGTPVVGVINETFAREAFGGEDPLGRPLMMLGWLEFTVIGVVPDVLERSPRAAARAEAYLSFEQFPSVGPMSLVARVTGEPLAFSSAIRQAIWSVDADVPLAELAPMTDVVRGRTAPTRTVTILFGIFGGVALFLGLVGVYGVISHSVRARTREIGIRMALGADRRGVLAGTLARAAPLVAAGLTLGLVGAMGLTRFLESRLFQVQAGDPAVLTAVVVVVGVAAGLAILVPARRAARTDPMGCLRTE